MSRKRTADGARGEGAVRVVVLVTLLVAATAGPLAAQQAPAPPLVTVERALQATQAVQVAVVVDRSSVKEGPTGAEFAATGPAGERLEVETSGKLPPGFAVASTVVLVGAAREGRFHATRVLVPAAQREDGSARGLRAVLGVTLVVWVGLFLYVLRLDRRLHRLEE